MPRYSLDEANNKINDLIKDSYEKGVKKLLNCTSIPTAQLEEMVYMIGELKKDPEVVLAIRDHYNPRFDGDAFPESLHGVIIAIADRLDTMVSCFENNAIPTGSRDPWGIRRTGS